MHDVDDANERRRAIGDRRWSSQNLDALDVAHAHARNRWIEGTAPRYSVDDEQKRVEFAQSPKLGYSARRPCIAAWRDRDAGGQCESILQRLDPARSQVAAAYDFDRGGAIVRCLWPARGHNPARRQG